MKQIICTIIAAFVLLYHGIAADVWQWRNPKANRMTVWTNYTDMIMLRKLDKFQ